jgi:hypothetical protein
MGIIVKHRQDRQLHHQRRIKNFSGQIASALVKFLDDEIIGRVFSGETELQYILNEWNAFAKKNRIFLENDFLKIRVADGMIFWLKMGEPFAVGLIEKIGP